MPWRKMAAALREDISPWRLLLLTVVAYVVIRLAIPQLVAVGIPFWVRAIFLALLTVVGVIAERSSWLSRRH